MLSSDLSMQYLLMLPLPLSGRGARARLHGVAYMHLDARFRPLGSRRLLLCRTPPHVLPAPALMLAQRIDPRAAAGAACELEFYTRIRRLLDESPCLVTYSFGYLEALDAIGLRTFRTRSIFAGVEHLLDVRQAVEAARRYGSLPPGPQDLLGTARQAGFATQVSRGDHCGRLEALAFLLTALVRREPQLMALCFTALSEQEECLRAACSSHERCLYLQGPHLRPCLCLALGHDQLSVLTRGSELHVLRLPLSARPLLYPEPMLSAVRRRPADPGLEAEHERLAQAADDAGQLPQREQGFFEPALRGLSAPDRAFCRQFADHDPRALLTAPLNLSRELRLRHFLFTGDNLYAALTDAEQARYRSCCAGRIAAQLPAFERAVERLRQSLPSGDGPDREWLQYIAGYPDTLRQQGGFTPAQP